MSKKYKITIFILIAAALLTVIAGAAVIIIGQRESHGNVVEDLNKENESLEREGEKLESDLEGLKNEKRTLEAKIAELESKLADSGKYFEDEIAVLKAELDGKIAEIAALEEDIEKYKTIFSIDVRAQAQLIDEIVEYIESASPYALVTSDGGKEWVLISELIAAERAALGDEPLFTPEELAASGLTEAEFTEKLLRERVFAREDVEYPSIGVYYEDLSTGYHFDYEATKVFDAASVIKAPYILSLLKKVSADEKAFFDRITDTDGFVPEMVDTDGDGEPDKIKIEYSDPIYDLSETVIYDKSTMWKSGSGKIKDMEDGTEFTYIDFIKYTLEHSDNVAYQQLRSRFGFSLMQELALSLKANSIFKGGNSMSAADAGKLFKAIYQFTEEDEKYGSIMVESMKNSAHTVIIPYAVSPTKVMHKYGWDAGAYNDAGIVLSGDKPYVIAVFSNMDNGGTEVNAFLQGIVRRINKLHNGFYNS